MKKLEKKVLETIEEVQKVFEKNVEIEKLEEANENFKEMVSRGLVKERGNNLLSTSDVHIKTQVWFNT